MDGSSMKLAIVSLIEAPFTYFNRNDEYKNTCSVGKLCWRNEARNNTKEMVSHCCIGYLIELLKKIEDELDIITYLYIVEDGAYGAHVNNTWTGLVGDLVYGKADLILAYFSISAARLKVLDFTEDVLPADFVLVTRVNKTSLSFLNIKAFSSLKPLLWLSIFAIIFIFSFLLIIAEEIVRTNSELKYSWIESITYLTGLLFQRDIGGMNPNFLEVEHCQ